MTASTRFVESLRSVSRRVAGAVLIALGLLGAFIPIPLVPFFLLALAGIKLYGDGSPRLNKLRAAIEARLERAKKR